MKSFFRVGLSLVALIVGSVASARSLAPTDQIPSVCYQNAAEAVEVQVEPGYYDDDGISTYDCVFSADKSQILCTVGAFKGGGDAADTFEVVLDKNCTPSSVELVGEE